MKEVQKLVISSSETLQSSINTGFCNRTMFGLICRALLFNNIDSLNKVIISRLHDLVCHKDRFGVKIWGSVFLMLHVGSPKFFRTCSFCILFLSMCVSIIPLSFSLESLTGHKVVPESMGILFHGW